MSLLKSIGLVHSQEVYKVLMGSYICVFDQSHWLGRVQNSSLVDDRLPKVKSLWTVDEQLGGWSAAQKKFFAASVSRLSRSVICS